MLFCNTSSETREFLNSLIKKRIPTVEIFEFNQIKILKDLAWHEKILLVLYYVNKRITNQELVQMLNPPHTSYISTYNKILEKRNLIHINSDGVRITALGIKLIEENSNKYLVI